MGKNNDKNLYNKNVIKNGLTFENETISYLH